jgi:hypothetical protein
MPFAGDDGINGVCRVALSKDLGTVAWLDHSASRFDPVKLAGIHALEGCNSK